MAKFMLDGQEYCGGGGSNQIVKLTQAEYDALPNDKLSNNTIYLITDSGELTAENLFYDDTETGLGVNNVQDAIVEQNKKIAIVECVSSNVKDTYVHLSYPNGFNQNNCVIIGLNSSKWGTWYCESITNGVFGIGASLTQEVIDVGVVKEDGFNLPVKVVLCKMS